MDRFVMIIGMGNNIPVVKLMANFGTEDPASTRIFLTFKDLIEKMDIDNLDEADFKLDRIFEELSIARTHLLAIEDKKFSQLATADQQKEYKGFYGSLWSSYRDRFKKFMFEMGYDLSLIFCSDKEFKKLSIQFAKDHPKKKRFIEYAKKQRDGWQKILHTYRTNTEHGGDRRRESVDIENVENAKQLYEAIWRSMEDVFIFLCEEKMKKGWVIKEIAEKDRDPSIPKRFIPWLRSLT